MTAPPSVEAAPSAIRIAFVVDRMFLPAGGTETQLLHVLERLDRHRFDPTLFCLQGSEWLRDGFDRCPHQVLDLHLGRSPSVLAGVWRFSRILRSGGYDVVQTHFRDSNIVGVLAGALAGVPHIVSTRRGVPYWSTKAGLVFLRLLNRRVDRFLANSRATAERLCATEGVDPSRVRVIYNGLEPHIFRSSSPANRESLRSALGIPPGAPVVGVVANLRPVKGLDDFVRATALVARELDEVRFLIVGQGPEGPHLRALAESLGVSRKIQLLGPRDDVPALLSVFDVGVLSSHFESFSNSILEYLAADLPVVVTNVGGAPEAVRHEVDGYLVPPRRPDLMAERIRSLLEHPGGARSWKRDRGVQEKFLLENVISEYEGFYERLASHTP